MTQNKKKRKWTSTALLILTLLAVAGSAVRFYMRKQENREYIDKIEQLRNEKEKYDSEIEKYNKEIVEKDELNKYLKAQLAEIERKKKEKAQKAVHRNRDSGVRVEKGH